jgi:hypothetical protein
MSADHPELRLEIGHVLFIDIVGYSKLLITAQKESLQELNRIVRGIKTVRDAEAADKLIRIPTGDGMALVFSTTPEAPVECALEISKALRSHSRLPVRMGVHSGPVSASPTSTTAPTLPAPESTSRSASWIAVMPATSFSPNTSPKTSPNTPNGNRTSTTWANAK